MFRLEHHHIGDPWFWVEDGVAHMWFLTQPMSLPADERGKHWDIGYAISSNLNVILMPLSDIELWRDRSNFGEGRQEAQ